MVLLILQGPKLNEIAGKSYQTTEMVGWQLIVGFVEVSLLPLLPTAGKSIGMVYLLGSELGSAIRL